MDESRLPVQLFKWERSLNHKGWVKDLDFILAYCNMSECADLDVLCDLDVAEARLKYLNRDKWWVECHSKPKLRTYVQIHDKREIRSLVKHNLSRKHRSQVSRFKFRTLPLSLETGRYNDVEIEDRVCVLCASNSVETEEHFVLVCPNLEAVRKPHLQNMGLHGTIEGVDNIEKMKRMLGHENLKKFCIMLEEMLEELDLLDLRRVVFPNSDGPPYGSVLHTGVELINL